MIHRGNRPPSNAHLPKKPSRSIPTLFLSVPLKFNTTKNDLHLRLPLPRLDPQSPMRPLHYQFLSQLLSILANPNVHLFCSTPYPLLPIRLIPCVLDIIFCNLDAFVLWLRTYVPDTHTSGYRIDRKLSLAIVQFQVAVRRYTHADTAFADA